MTILSDTLAYASLTRTRRNLDALRIHGWRILLSPLGSLDPHGFAFALDNGAWSYYQRGIEFDDRPFLRAVEKVGATADFIALPDIVAGGMRSLALSLSYLDQLQGLQTLLLVPVQDGIPDREIALLPRELGLFIGGTTAFKESWLRRHVCQVPSRYVHVGRVNTCRRIALVRAAHCHSFDGTSASRFASTTPLLDRARHARPTYQLAMAL